MPIDKLGSPLHLSNDIQPQRVQTRENVSLALNQSNEQTNSTYSDENYKEPPQEIIEEAVDNLNQFIEPVRRNLKFELHDKLEKYYVKVVDSTTDEVIKEIPPKEMLDMYAEMVEFMGLLVDKKI